MLWLKKLTLVVLTDWTDSLSVINAFPTTLQIVFCYYLPWLQYKNTVWMYHFYSLFSETVAQRSSKKLLGNNFLRFTRKYLQWCSFLVKLQISLQFYWKSDAIAGVFLWILKKFSELLFYRTPPGDCFYILRYSVRIWGNSLHRKWSF